MKLTGCFFYFLLISFFSAAHGYTVFEQNGRVGLKDERGQVVIPAEYDALGWSDGTFTLTGQVTGYRQNMRWGLIDVSNHRITKPLYESLLPGNSSLIIARKKSSLSLRMVTGCISLSGKEVIPFEYDGLSLTSLRAIVFTKIGNQFKYGLIDLQNHTLIPQQYQRVYAISPLRFAVQNFDNKIALYTDNGKAVTTFTIDSLSDFRNGYAIVYQDGKQGLADRDGQIRVENSYREVRVLANGTAEARNADTWLFLDGQNKEIRRVQADSVIGLGKNLFKVESAGQIKLTDGALSPRTQYAINFLDAFNNGRAIFASHGRYGILNENGSVFLQPAYDKLIADRNFILANTRINNRDNWTLLDTLGVRRMARTYEYIHPFNGRIFEVRYRGYWGALNYLGQEVIACVYDSLLEMKDEHVVVKFHGQYGILNFKEDWVVAPRTNRLAIVDGSHYLEYAGNRTQLKSYSGEVIYFTDNRLELFHDFMLEHLPSGSVWKIDFQGVIVDRQVYPEDKIERIFEESEGLRAIQRNGRYGFVDSRGRLRIANRYEAVQRFSEELAPARILGKWGFINHQDNIAVQPVYDQVSLFKNGVAIVKLKGLYGAIDKKGRLLLPVRYESVVMLPTKNLLVRENKLMGLADVTGRMLIIPRFDEVNDLGTGYAVVQREGKYGVLTLQGVSTVPLMYDYIRYDKDNGVFLALQRAAWQAVTVTPVTSR